MVTISAEEDLVYNQARLEEVCSLFDGYYIANSTLQMNKKYIALSSIIYSDGSYTKDAHRDGYVHIENIRDASYIIFINANEEIYLAVYKYIPESKLADVEVKFKELRSLLPSIADANNDGLPDNNTINMEDPRCPFCNEPIVVCNSSMDKMLHISKCNICKKGYTLEPDENFKITSITNYNKKKERISK